MAGQSTSAPPAEFTTADLRIYLLGPPHVERAGRALDIPRRQARALLYYLAAHLRPAPRERLCFLFWPDVPESAARRNLSRMLSHLRRALSAPGALVASNDHVGLDPEQVWSDTATFEHLYDTPGALPKAVDLYRGAFLDGFSLPGDPEFEAWLVQEQQTWERRYLEALATLIEAQTDRGAHEVAVAYARRYLAVDELDEDVHRRLIELYAAIGDHGAALRQFEYCATVLERELGVSPLPETQAVYQAILGSRTRSRPHTTPAPVWTTRPSLQAPLIGRNEALYRLAQAYERARSGQGGVVLISGEAGIGKSRLMQDFVSGLESEATVLSGGGHEAEQDLPYWPLVEALGSHLPAINWAALNVESLHLAEVARLFPELRTLIPNLPPPAIVEPGQEQGRLFLALTRWLLGLAALRPPLVLCLDDLHWADEATLAWLGYLGRQLKRAALLVLGAHRAEEAARVATLRAGLLRLGVLQEVMLEGLLPAEVRRLVRRLAGQADGDGRLGRRLYQETGGNPFFLLETVRAMIAAGPLRQGETVPDDAELPLPDTVYEAIQDRLRHLTPQARRVLEAGAVIGQPFDLDLVQATSDLGASEVLDALESLLARQIITEHEGRYRFNHGLVRTAVYRDLGHDRRRLLHRRAVEASQAAARRDER